MANNVIPGMAGIYVRSTGEHVSANIFGPSRHGDNYIPLKYMRNGKEIEHNAAFDKVLFPIRSPSPSPSKGFPTHLLPHVSRACTASSKHGVGVEPHGGGGGGTCYFYLFSESHMYFSLSAWNSSQATMIHPQVGTPGAVTQPPGFPGQLALTILPQTV